MCHYWIPLKLCFNCFAYVVKVKRSQCGLKMSSLFCRRKSWSFGTGWGNDDRNVIFGWIKKQHTITISHFGKSVVNSYKLILFLHFQLANALLSFMLSCANSYTFTTNSSNHLNVFLHSFSVLFSFSVQTFPSPNAVHCAAKTNEAVRKLKRDDFHTPTICHCEDKRKTVDFVPIMTSFNVLFSAITYPWMPPTPWFY